MPISGACCGRGITDACESCASLYRPFFPRRSAKLSAKIAKLHIGHIEVGRRTFVSECVRAGCSYNTFTLKCITSFVARKRTSTSRRNRSTSRHKRSDLHGSGNIVAFAACGALYIQYKKKRTSDENLRAVATQNEHFCVYMGAVKTTRTLAAYEVSGLA